MCKIRVVLGADHNGVSLKIKLRELLLSKGYECIDLGPYDLQPVVDYMDYAFQVAAMVADSQAQFGILTCGTGIGMSIAANRLPKVRAALVHNEISAKKSREHNNANVLCLGAWVNDDATNLHLASLWLSEAFGEGRHCRRVDKIDSIYALRSMSTNAQCNTSAGHTSC